MRTETPLYEEIDLRPYVQAVVRRWWLIAAVGLVAGVLAYVVLLFVPPTYESSALVLVTKPRFNLQFDPRIQTPDTAFAYLAYPTLALSDVVVDELVAAMEPASVEVFRQRLSAKNGTDPSLIVLTVTHPDPVRAAEVANAWAELFVGRANQVFGRQGDEPVLFLQAQLVRSQADLERIEGQLVAFQAQNRQQILNAELTSVLQTQTNYLNQQRQTADLLWDVQAYGVELALRPAGDVLPAAEVTALTLLQARAFAMGVEGSPFLLDVSSGGEGQMLVREGGALLTSLQGVLGARLEAIGQALLLLEPAILATQEDLQRATNEHKRLQSELDLTFATYTSLARTLDEVMITAEDTMGQVRLASYAGVAEEPTGPRKGRTTAVGVFVGFLITLMTIILTEWYSREITN